MRFRFLMPCLLAGLVPVAGSGCAVHQPRGEGEYRRVKEPRTGGIYHLYLPVDYVRNGGRHPDHPRIKRWPLVMTFHGMKPYDNAIPQEREWEKEADIYGYIVCAPELRTCDSFMEYPLTREHGYVKKDRERVLAIMDHVFNTTTADPRRVLSTSWSCGGYLAHYFPNRYPDRFSCIATRLSNFSAKLLLEDTVPAYKDRVPVGIFIGDGDFPACKKESEQAVAWYKARDFRLVLGKMIDRMGHRRIPQTAAAFFAEQLGIQPLHPEEAARTVAQVRMTDYTPPGELIARMAPAAPPETVAARARRPRTPTRRAPPAVKPPEPSITRRPAFSYVSTNAGRDYPFEKAARPEPAPGKRAGPSGPGARPSTPPTGANATRVASASRSRRANWLEPVAPAAGAARRRTPGRTPPPKARPAADPGPLALSKPAARPTRSKRRSGAADLPAARRSPPKRPPAKAKPAPPPATKAPGRASRPFSPKDAGPRRYDLWPVRNSPLDRRTARPTGPRAASARKARRPDRSRPTPRLARVRPVSGARRVSITLDGPAIGSAPYYLSYRVDLPPELIEGADFLWKDNGVWMGDEPRGVKILDAPGLHRISVLLVTRNNAEYRGMATVQVLEAGSSTARSRR